LTAPSQIDVTINPIAITAEFEREVNGVTQMLLATSTGLSAVPDGKPFDLPKVFWSVGKIDSMSAATRELTMAWVLGSALVQIVESLARAVDDFRLMCAIAKSDKREIAGWSSKPHADLRQLAEHLIGGKEANKHVKAGLAPKLKSLKEEFGIATNVDTTELSALYQLRNCFTHRFGIVGHEDVDESGLLRLTWRDVAPVIVDQSGVVHRLDKSHGRNLTVQNPATLRLEFGSPRVQEFRVADRVHLLIQDVLATCLTCLIACKQLQVAVTNYMVAQGLPQRPVDA
jgi:hypothetical protein